MATTIEVRVRELVARNRATSRAAECIGSHKTLCIGILYVITIVAILAVAARL